MLVCIMCIGFRLPCIIVFSPPTFSKKLKIIEKQIEYKNTAYRRARLENTRLQDSLRPVGIYRFELRAEWIGYTRIEEKSLMVFKGLHFKIGRITIDFHCIDNLAGLLRV